MKPLFRWAGSKTKMKTKYGSSFWPNGRVDRFIDPFFGTGAVSMWAAERYDDLEIIANDLNSDIINIYENIKKDVKIFIDRVSQYESEYLPKGYEQRRSYYYQLRDYHAWEYESISLEERAALLFFMLKTSFNGFWQINKNTNGKFGTPVGLANETVEVFNRHEVESFALFCQNITFLSADYSTVKDYINKGSYLYLDPPYRDSYTMYTAAGFDDCAQKAMLNFMNNADEKGAFVSMSNKYHFDNFFENILNDSYNVITYDVKYTAGRGAKSGEKVKATECFIRNFNSADVTNFL